MLEPTIKAIEAVDENLGAVVDAIHEKGGYAIIFADHGNADTMSTEDRQPHTAHSNRTGSCDRNQRRRYVAHRRQIGRRCSTMLDLLNVEKPAEKIK